MRRSRRSKWSAAALWAALAVVSVAADARPQRVASIHLCADQLLLALADRDQIASVTWLAAEPAQSNMVEAARGVSLNRGQAEEIVALKPDLVLAGVLSARPTVALLQRLGYRVLDLAPTTSFVEINSQIREVAAALDEIARGEALVAALGQRLAVVASAAPSAARPGVILYQPNGYTMGAGTLEDAVLTAAGFANLARGIGITGVGHVPLERLVLLRPDLIVFGAEGRERPSAARELLSHPAMAAMTPRSVDVPNRFWVCGGWFTAEAVERLAAQR